MFYFTPLPGFFSPFPRGTVSLSVTQEYLALRGGPRRFTRNSTCSVLLGIQLGQFGFRVRGFHPLWRVIQNTSTNFSGPRCCPTTPMAKTIGLGSSLFARRYLGSRFYFPFLQLLRCFSSLGWLAPAYGFSWPY